MASLFEKVKELFGKPELAADVETMPAEAACQPQSPSWPCPRCGKPAAIDEVCPSFDGERTLTLWHCKPCETVGATPDAVRQPPVWVSKRVH